MSTVLIELLQTEPPRPALEDQLQAFDHIGLARHLDDHAPALLLARELDEPDLGPGKDLQADPLPTRVRSPA
jgi:hypothetical protein